MGEAPREDFVVSAALQDAGAKGGILDAQESAAPAIGAGTKVGVKVRSQAAGGVEADLVEHPGEVDDAASLVVGATRHGVLNRRWHGIHGVERKLVAMRCKGNSERFYRPRSP